MTLVKLLHTSDWHLGRTLMGADLLPAQTAFLDWLLDLALREQVDAVLVAGDVYDRAVPSVDALRALERTLVALSTAGIPVILISGNHDSATRLGFGSALHESAGVHLRTRVADLDRPVVLSDEHGEVAIYGVPYLLPDAVRDELGAERSHEAVLSAATARILADAEARGIRRTVALAHAFITGGHASDSERDIRVGGIGDAPAHVFNGVTYVALGHLHGPQQVSLGGSATVLRYSGSPLAYSFSEKDHVKSVVLVELDATGVASATTHATPVERPLREARGTVEQLLQRAGGDLAELAAAYVKAVLTDQRRPMAPMERLRQVWPHTIALEFEPEGGLADSAADLDRLDRVKHDPVLVCGHFVEFVGGAEPDEQEERVLRAAVETAQRDGMSA